MTRTEKFFKNKVALITGASGGIGRDTALLLARAGAHVMLWSRDAKKLEALCAEICASGGTADFGVVDVREHKAVYSAMEQLAGKYGGIDFLVCNAGVGFIGKFKNMSREEICRVTETNFYGPVYCTQAALPFMRRGGNITFISSILGKRAVPGYAVYSATKFAIVGFAEALRTELEDAGIKVTVVCPTSTDTGFFANSGGDGAAERRPRGPVVMSSRDAALAVVDAIRKGRREVVLSFPAKVLALLNANVPSLMDIAVSRIFK
jgi:short-subunit dehydrogenase